MNLGWAFIVCFSKWIPSIETGRSKHFDHTFSTAYTSEVFFDVLKSKISAKLSGFDEVFQNLQNLVKTGELETFDFKTSYKPRLGVLCNAERICLCIE